MSKLARTPPSTPNSMNLEHSASEPNLASETSLGQNFATRTKRQRLEDSPTNSSMDLVAIAINKGLEDINTKLTDMLMTWKKEQESSIAKLLDEWREQKSTINGVRKDVVRLKEQCEHITKTNDKIQESMDFFNKTYEDIKKRIEKLECDKKENQDCLLTMERKIQDFQHVSRSSKIEIRNVPHTKDEKTANLTSIVMNLSRAVNVTLKPEHLRDIYRIPGQPGVIKPIVVEFTSVNTKNDLLGSVRRYNKDKPTTEKFNTEVIGLPGRGQPVYIDDYVPPSMKKLLHLTRVFAKENKYHCRYANGKVLVRKNPEDKFVNIKSEKCLSLLRKIE